MHVSTWNNCLTVSVDGRTYKVKDKITFRQHGKPWKADQITSSWSVPFVNRKRAKQARLESGYEEFRLWFQVYIQMTARPDDQTVWSHDKSTIVMLREARELIARAQK